MSYIMNSTGVEFTRLSEKGQIVIPSQIRKKMKLREGTRFIVLRLDDSILLRKVEASQERLRLRKLLVEAREKAARVGFTQREVGELVESSRKAVP